MGKASDQELEIAEMIEKYKNEAVTNAINAFNEGFLLGVKHAEQIFEEKEVGNEN